MLGQQPQCVTVRQYTGGIYLLQGAGIPHGKVEQVSDVRIYHDSSRAEPMCFVLQSTSGVRAQAAVIQRALLYLHAVIEWQVTHIGCAEGLT